jgi:hypothetical protein
MKKITYFLLLLGLLSSNNAFTKFIKIGDKVIIKYESHHDTLTKYYYLNDPNPTKTGGRTAKTAKIVCFLESIAGEKKRYDVSATVWEIVCDSARRGDDITSEHNIKLRNIENGHVLGLARISRRLRVGPENDLETTTFKIFRVLHGGGSFFIPTKEISMLYNGAKIGIRDTKYRNWINPQKHNMIEADNVGPLEYGSIWKISKIVEE